MLNANITYSPAIVHHHTVVKPSSKKLSHRTESANTSEAKNIEATRNKKTVLPLKSVILTLVLNLIVLGLICRFMNSLFVGFCNLVDIDDDTL
ncbi:hypothetical protein Tco_1307902 [Tanacetum coccineum]